jgi:hypothetical protein
VELVGDEIEEATEDDPGTWPVRVREAKTFELPTERLIELMEMSAPLVFATVNAPALEMVSPALTLMATLEVTVTAIWACAIPAAPHRQQAIRIIDQKPGLRFTCFTSIPVTV